MLVAESFFFFSSRRRHTRLVSDWSSDVCSSDLYPFNWHRSSASEGEKPQVSATLVPDPVQIGRASCRERVESSVGAGALKKKRQERPEISRGRELAARGPTSRQKQRHHRTQDRN